MWVFKADAPFEDLDNGVASRKGVMSDNTPATETRFTAGAFSQLQKRPSPQLIHVLSGEFEFTLGSQVHIVMAKETLAIPADTLFGCFCLTAGSLLETPLAR